MATAIASVTDARASSPSAADGSAKDTKGKDTSIGHATADGAAGQITAATPDPSAQNAQPAAGIATPMAVNPQAVAAVAPPPTAAAAAAALPSSGPGNDPLTITGDAPGNTGGPQLPARPSLTPAPATPADVAGTSLSANATGKAATPNAGGDPSQTASAAPQTAPGAPAPIAAQPAALPALETAPAVAITTVAVAGLASPVGNAPDLRPHDAAAPTDASGNAGSAVQAQTANGAAGTATPATPARPSDAAAAAPVPIAEVAVAIAAHAQSGRNRFEIRLDPPELGRIDVQLNMDGNGNVSSRLIVERPDTLNLLVRDAPQLQRALQDAGLNTGGGMQFSLADQGFASRNGFAQQNDFSSPPPSLSTAGDTVPIAALQGYGAWSGRMGGLDITV